MKEKRIAYLDGIRGIASLIVVFYHYLISFYPALFASDPQFSHTNSNIESSIAVTPINILYNSGFAVCLFFLLSGFVLSHKYFINRNLEYLSSSAVKRYFRLEIPILVSVIISFIILSLNGYSYVQEIAGYTKCSFWLARLWTIHPDFLDALNEAFVSSMFYGGTLHYNDVLWTMNIEFVGSLLVFIVLALVSNLRRRYLIYLALMLMFWKGLMPVFIVGLALCDYYTYKERAPLKTPLIILFSLIILYMGSYQRIDHFTIWQPLDRLQKINQAFPYLIASVLLIMIAVSSKKLQVFLSLKWMAFLGKISFSLYLLHLLVLGSISCYLFKLFYIQMGLNYFSSFLLMFILSLTFTMYASYLMYKYVDRNAIRFSSYFYEKLFKR